MPPRAAHVTAGRPFLKWAGGKTQLLAQFAPLYPPRLAGRYIEPFLGGGAVFFDIAERLRPRKALLFDYNDELIRTFVAVRDEVDAVIAALDEHRRRHRPEHYYAVRAQPLDTLSPAERAARVIYLNKTCFNGLYRVNSRGIFNVPLGRQENKTILDEVGLRQASATLKKAQLRQGHFREVLKVARAGDFVYLDPPYVPISATAKFTSYTSQDFGVEDQRELAQVFRKLVELGCDVMLSNSDSPLVRELYGEDFHVTTVRARRMINSNITARGQMNEIVVTSYDPDARSRYAHGAADEDLHPGR